MSHDSRHMTPDEFRRWGRAAIDWIADYMEQVESYPVLSHVRPGEIRAGLPPHPPTTGEPFEPMLQDVSDLILPGITHWQSPNFFAYFPANASGPGDPGRPAVLGAGRAGHALGHQPGLHRARNARARLDGRDAGPAGQLPVHGGRAAVSSRTRPRARRCARSLAARERATGGRSQRDAAATGGWWPTPRPRPTPPSRRRAKIAGIGRANLRVIEVDGGFAMRPDALAAGDRRRPRGRAGALLRGRDRRHHLVERHRPVARDRAHLPASRGCGCTWTARWPAPPRSAPSSATSRPGWRLADSYCFNPHKWMFTNFDCDCFYVADRRGADPGALSDPARVPAQRGDRVAAR